MTENTVIVRFRINSKNHFLELKESLSGDEIIQTRKKNNYFFCKNILFYALLLFF